MPYVIEVVMLAACPDTFLRVGCSDVLSGLRAEEDRFELVHSSVGEQQRRIVDRQQRTGRDHGMASLLEKRDKLAPQLFARPFHHQPLTIDIRPPGIGYPKPLPRIGKEQ